MRERPEFLRIEFRGIPKACTESCVLCHHQRVSLAAVACRESHIIGMPLRILMQIKGFNVAAKAPEAKLIAEFYIFDPQVMRLNSVHEGNM